MKSDTRQRIIELISTNSSMRPIELIQSLALSPQAIHRHLSSLLAAGDIERRGRGPLTRYSIAGAPQLEKVLRWYSAPTPDGYPDEFTCETRDIFTARLPRLASYAKQGLNEGELPLVISAAGEVGNNSFDHNLGNWRDIPGCWFETQATGRNLWICIADRGQGVLRSLARTDPSLTDDQAALVTAFEKSVSGRAPEKRGNGLKFVRNIITRVGRRGLACRSGSGLVEYGSAGPECRKELSRFPAQPAGTITLMLWSLE